MTLHSDNPSAIPGSSNRDEGEVPPIRRLFGRVLGLLPAVRRLRRERDRARAECRRLLGLLSGVAFQGSAVLAHRRGLTLLLEASSTVDRLMFTDRSWEGDQLELLLATARTFMGSRERKLFLDIGAHWGLYALSAWQLRMFDTIVCFEPDRHNFAQLMSQLFLNGAAYDVEARLVAVSDRSGVTRIRQSTTISDGNRGSAMIGDELDQACSYPVETVAIDDIFPVRDHIVFAKIDVEGAERRVLDGMRRMIAGNRVYLQMEVLEGNEANVLPYVPADLTLLCRIGPDYIFTNFKQPDANPSDGR